MMNDVTPQYDYSLFDAEDDHPSVSLDGDFEGYLFDAESESDTEEEVIEVKCDSESTDYMKLYKQSTDFLRENKILISTITVTGYLGDLINLRLLIKYANLSPNGIVSIRLGSRRNKQEGEGKKKRIRSIIKYNMVSKYNGTDFDNQVTILMKPTNPDRNYLNIKLFKNGSVQLTGCKCMDDCHDVLARLTVILRKGRTVEIEGVKKRVSFVKNPDLIGIYRLKVGMINSNFKIPTKVNRAAFYAILKMYHGSKTVDKEIGFVDCKYHPSSHASVDIFYKYDENKQVSIYVFQTGAIIITGANTLQHIICAYKYIMNLLHKYEEKIKIIELDPKLVQIEYIKYMKLKHATI
jgi:TATA-box binding protein (TBP) (component of TFIID and TFIIIB)